MKISLVIPVYNDAEQLADCLRAVADQRRPADEVIVVDNNSTDGSAQLAASYSFVTLIREPRQGVVHARTCGFNKASGDVIARIDADSRLPEDWLAQVEQVMSDEAIAAVSGKALYHSIALAPVFNNVDLFFRRRLSRQLKDHVYLWGANMAIRRKAWRLVRSEVCYEPGLHEDFDLGLHLQASGHQVVFAEKLKASVSARRFAMTFAGFLKYIHMIPATYQHHGLKFKRYFWPVVVVSAIGYWPGRLLHRGYSRTEGRFRLSTLLATTLVPRVDPATFVVSEKL